MASIAAVLDTNAVLDCFAFRDGHAARLAADIQAGRVRWLGTAAMRTELEHVLTRPPARPWQESATATLAAWDAWAHAVNTPAPGGAEQPVCRDPDDQKFIDLAVDAGCRWLLTRDRALLCLAKPALLRHKLQIVVPAAWPGELD